MWLRIKALAHGDGSRRARLEESIRRARARTVHFDRGREHHFSEQKNLSHPMRVCGQVTLPSGLVQKCMMIIVPTLGRDHPAGGCGSAPTSHWTMAATPRGGNGSLPRFRLPMASVPWTFFFVYIVDFQILEANAITSQDNSHVSGVDKECISWWGGALLGFMRRTPALRDATLGGTGFQHEGSLMADTPTASHISFPVFFGPFYPVYIQFFFFFLYIFVCVGRSIFKGRLGTGIYHSYNESRKIGPEEGLGGIIKLPLALGGTMNQTKHTPTTLLLLRCYDLFIMRARLLDSRVAVGGSLFCCRGPRSQKRVCLSSACS